MSRPTRDGTAEEPVSRDQTFRRVRGQGNINFPCSADHEEDWLLYPVDPHSVIRDDHTYIHTHTHRYIGRHEGVEGALDGSLRQGGFKHEREERLHPRAGKHCSKRPQYYGSRWMYKVKADEPLKKGLIVVG